ncbi:UBP-type zinc finger domain-containing protein [Streptomyces polyrhachis]|uniref:UBP-type zinc finger domain-containing protein n=1 Tax=Streptomyces polyrhachis TaxID=1282885 RepID=A0ABW2GQ87_9ACTN
MTVCPHVAELPSVEVTPRSATCEACVAAGTHPVHLRLCLGCGHVACCDSSPHRHATAHARESGHPVMRSFEPGEDWRWCYVDESLV